MKQEFTYVGSVVSGVTFGRGKAAVEVALFPGRRVLVDPDNAWVKTAVAKRVLVPVLERAAPEPPDVPASDEANASDLAAHRASSPEAESVEAGVDNEPETVDAGEAPEVPPLPEALDTLHRAFTQDEPGPSRPKRKNKKERT